MGAVKGFSELEARLDKATTALLPGLRTTKRLDALALAEVLDVADEFASALASREDIPRALVGKLWFVFTAILTEADHASEPEPLLDAAWDYQERLRKIFGPTL